MNKYLMLLLVIVFASTIMYSPAQATPPKRYDLGTKTCRALTMENDLAGHKVFRKFCKGCHNRVDGEGGFLYTESKTSTAWNRLFFEKYAVCARDGAWKNLTQDDLLKLNDYLFRTAFGTYDPNNADDCG